MAGLLDVAEMIGMIGAAAKLTAAELREAADAQRSYNEEAANSETTSSMNSAGGGTSSMGASSGGPVTAAGMSLALKQNQGRL